MKINIVTPKSDGIIVEISAVCINSQYVLQYEEQVKFKELCKDGCPNYKMKWSCPPYSPFYHDISKDCVFLTVCLLTVQLYQFDYINRDYLKIKAANSILKSRADKMLRENVSGKCKGISTGSCRLCKPCRCKLEEPCRNPNKVMYSFEALGINVSCMIKDLFNFELQWYSKGLLPEYTSVVVGILSEEKVNVEGVYSTFRQMSKHKSH